MVKLSSSEGQEFTVDREIAEKSVLIKNMLEDVGESDNAIPLPNVTGPILQKVIEWCTHHRNDPPAPIDDEARHKALDDIDEWDEEFVKVDQGTLFELILAANYLDIKPLLDLTCKTVANMIKGKSPEEIRKTFNIVNDFTPEEEEQWFRRKGTYYMAYQKIDLQQPAQHTLYAIAEGCLSDKLKIMVAFEAR